MSYRKTKPGPIDRLRIRKIKDSFSQIEHRFINGRYIDLMDTGEILLYFFLIAVGDRNGVSFYSCERMASILQISVVSIEKDREGLVNKEFIAYRNGVYQVLELPELLLDDLERS